MNMQYYGTRLSENISRREPEGYLLCLNVPVARSGTQEYRPGELGISAAPPDLIPVCRPEEEVFSPAAMASFEGMPVTNDHPPDGVDIFNARTLQKGHTHNVRRGSGSESDLLLADLIITDPGLIEAILGGKREISCGYTYELCEENGRYVQRKIRGNHVAVVDAGRAGSRVSIKDHKTVENTERSKCIMKKSLSKILARMAKDGDTETVAEILEEMMQTEEGEAPETPAEETGAVIETPAENGEEAADGEEVTLADIAARLDRLIALLAPAADEDPVTEQITEAVGEAVEAVLAEAPAVVTEETIEEIVEEIVDPALSAVIPDLPEEDEDEEDPGQELICSADALRSALKAVRPALARMPRKQRRQVCADIALRLKGIRQPAADSRVYADLASARRKPAGDPAELGRRIMASRNANIKK